MSFLTSLLNALPGAVAQGLIWGIMAIGVYITYRILDVADLTVDGSLATGGAVCVMCLLSGMNVWAALFIALLAGLATGLVTGLLHTFMGIPAILAGILTQLALYSINMHIMGGKSNLTVSRTQYQFTLQANSLDALSNWVPQLLARLQALPQLSDVSSDWQDKGLAAYINVDRDSASRLGISMADVDNALYNAFGQRLISTIYTQANQYRVVLEHDTQATPGLAALDNIRLTSSDGGIVPLKSIASVEERFAPLSINHLDQFPVTTISFNVPDNYSLGDAVEAILGAEQALAFPSDIRTQFQGSSLAFQSALGSTVWLVVAAVVAMYIVLGVLYESFIHPITILSTLPTAGVGALLALWLAGSELDVIAIIGIILLIGIVKKNAIMMIDFALAAEREQGMPPREAIYQACLLRFRPILMTTLAALLGALPLMLSTGVGAELRRPLGIGMVGGLMLSQVLTLFTTPVIYLLFDRLSLYMKSRFPRREEEA